MADTGTSCLTVTRARACDGSGRHQAPLGRQDRMQFFFLTTLDLIFVTMKFSLASTLLVVGSVTAFTPIFGAPRASIGLKSTAEKVYTFAKSDEIFTEAKEVSTQIYIYISTYIVVIKGLSSLVGTIRENPTFMINDDLHFYPGQSIRPGLSLTMQSVSRFPFSLFQ